MNTFKINYDTKELLLNYNGENFEWSLGDGDVGDFWHTFINSGGDVFDVNFHQESEKQNPSLCVYEIRIEDGIPIIDTSKYELIDSYTANGNMSNYFKI
jgi:hypothetical protein